MPHLRLGSEIEFPDELLDTQLRDEWTSLKALGDSVRQNLKLRPITAPDDVDADTERPPFLSPTVPFHAASAHSLVALTPSPPVARGPPPHLRSRGSETPATPQPLSLDGVLARPHALVIDTRPPESHSALHVPGSVNLFFLSLKLKRLCKPGALTSISGLQTYITSDAGRDSWNALMLHWDHTVVVYDDNMDDPEPGAAPSTSTPWSLLTILTQLPECYATYYLAGGLRPVASDPRLARTEPSDQVDTVPTLMKKPSNSALGGRFELLTSSPEYATLPELEPNPAPPAPPTARTDSTSSLGQSGYLSPPSRSFSPAVTSRSPSLHDFSPSPSPSAASFSPRMRNGAPKLTRLDTKSTERLSPSLVLDSAVDPSPPPKLHLHTQTRPTATKAATVPLRPLNLRPPNSPSYLSSSPTSPAFPRSPRSPSPVPPTPGTVRAFPGSAFTPTPGPSHSNEFEVSIILPGFLYLGPEPTTQQHVQELEKLGVRRIISVAVECDDDQGLGLRRRFDKYFRIPMRDTVEEENVGRGARDVCAFLDDARLHSSPTYVHCKAGKSRSVTMVMAYLIHANHWPLWRAYSFVLERRREISPNIGFVSELMNFEERALGTKSVGVLSSPPEPDSHPPPSNSQYPQQAQAPPTGKAGNFSHLAASRRNHAMRESLPPAFSTPLPAEDLGAGAEVEVRDSTGRYRHARRAPVDESTLQPGRRVSKAGLEGAGVGGLG